MKRIIYSTADGGVTVVTPVINTHALIDGAIVARPEDVDEEMAIQRSLAKLPPWAIDPKVVEESAIPADRTFRLAWKASGSAVVHDMEKARHLHRENMRSQRKPKLELLDVKVLCALEKGDISTLPSLVAEKQVLRDVTATPGIEAASTIEELKAVWPDCLK